MELTLDAAGALPRGRIAVAKSRRIQVGPQLRISDAGDNRIVVHNSQGVEEVGIAAPADARHPPTDEVEMLRIQVNGFEKVIQRLQAEIAAREKSQAQTAKLVQSLRDRNRRAQRAGSREQRSWGPGAMTHGR